MVLCYKGVMKDAIVTIDAPRESYWEFLSALNALISNKRKGATVNIFRRNGSEKELLRTVELRDFVVWTRWESWTLADASGYEKDIDNSAEPTVTLEGRWNTKSDYDHEPLLEVVGLDYITFRRKCGENPKDYDGDAHYRKGETLGVEIIQNK